MKKRDKFKPLITALVLSFIFGMSIEVLQELCTSTRKADLMDILANVSGAMLAFVSMLFLKKSKCLEKI